MKKILVPIFISIFLVSLVQAQPLITVDTNQTVERLIMNEFLQGGVSIRNIKYTGARRAIGHFECRSDSFPIKDGVLLTTGDAASIEGPNHNIEKTGKNNTGGDLTLTAIAQGRTWDACVVEFEFIPASENIAFDFVFASEEYPEYVNSAFNDVFAFMVSRVDSFQTFNIAYLPKTREPITVNNVNHLKNTSYFIENPAPSILNLIKHGLIKMPSETRKSKGEGDSYVKDKIECKTFLCNLIQYDGFTKMITAKAKVIPGKVYHFKIAIADVKDDILDSGVLLRAHSFRSYDKYGRLGGDTTGKIVMFEDVLPLPGPEEKKKEPEIVKQEEKHHQKISAEVLFDFDSDKLTARAEQVLAEFTDKLVNPQKGLIYIAAHTDAKGSDAYNQQLAKRRAQSVKEFIVTRGVDVTHLHISIFGESKPRVTNETEAGRDLNRRVEIWAE